MNTRVFCWKSAGLLQNTWPVYLWRSVTISRPFSSGKNESLSKEQEEKFEELPQKRLTRYEIDYLRSLRAEFPHLWPLRKLAKRFKISYPQVVKILKSKFQPSEEVAERQDRRAFELKNQARSIIKEVHRKEKLLARISALNQIKQNAQTHPNHWTQRQPEHELVPQQSQHRPQKNSTAVNRSQRK